jgi:hypothetical protein
MAYANTGQPGFNDALKLETANIVVGNNTYSFFWHDFIASDSEGTDLRVKIKGDALPVAINAGSVEAHETAFTPTPVTTGEGQYGKNFITFSNFQKIAVAQTSILVRLNFETFSGSKGAVQCKIMVDRSFRSYINNRWIAPMCS